MLGLKLRGLRVSADIEPLTFVKPVTTRSHNLKRLVRPSWSAEESLRSTNMSETVALTQNWHRKRLTCSVPQVPPSFLSLFWTLEKHFRDPLTPIWPTISLDADRDREPRFFARPDHRKRTRRIRRHLGVCLSETPLQRRRPPDWQAPIWMSHHVVRDCVGALVEIADRSLATQPEQVKGKKTQ